MASIPASDGGGRLEPAGNRSAEKVMPQYLSSSPFPPATVSPQQSDMSTVRSTDAIIALLHVRVFVYADFTPCTSSMKNVELCTGEGRVYLLISHPAGRIQAHALVGGVTHSVRGHYMIRISFHLRG